MELTTIKQTMYEVFESIDNKEDYEIGILVFLASVMLESGCRKRRMVSE